ncbi:MAG: VCBS repeat-containing protein [Candidatus Lokiarchaeota archaeon]|nr:VCBS repeat-containing protein [Candidatus Lokiarchaeota archaeon]
MSSSGHLDVLEDSLLNFTNAHDISLNAKRVVAGDFDGDCMDEILAITTVSQQEESYSVYDDAAHGYSRTHYGSMFWVWGGSMPGEDVSLETLIEAGDFDGDGIDEVFYCINLKTLPVMYYDIYLRVWDLNDSEVIASTMINDWTYPIQDVVAGDFDGDCRDEIALVGYNHRGRIYDDVNESFAVMHTFTTDGFSDGSTSYYCTAGDFDQDPAEEIIIGGRQGRKLVEVFDYVSPVFFKHDITSQEGLGSLSCYDYAAGNVDGDGLDELAIYAANGSTAGVYVLKKVGFSFTFDIIRTIQISGNNAGFVESGDVDSDGRSEIIVSAESVNKITVLDDANHDYQSLYEDTSHRGRLACGDFDGDGFILNFTGSAWQSVGPEGVILALAAPPTYKGISQNYISSYTAYGQETSIGMTNESSVGFTSMSGFSFEQDIDVYGFTVASASFSYSLSHEFAYTGFITSQTSVAASYASGSDDNSVIFHRTTYGCYEYYIDSEPFNSSLAGTRMTIDVPIASQIVQVTQAYYNSHYHPTIGAETFSHTVEQPCTYPSRSQLDAIAPSRWESYEMTVGQGTGFTAASITVGEQTGSSMSNTTRSEYTSGVGVAGGEYVFGWGGFDGTAYEITSGSASVYEGSVGNIQTPTEYEALQFSFGLCVYAITHPAGNSYQVINYYVEGAVPYYPPNDGMGAMVILAFFTGIGVIGLALVIKGQRKSGKRGKTAPARKMGKAEAGKAPKESADGPPEKSDHGKKSAKLARKTPRKTSAGKDQ